MGDDKRGALRQGLIDAGLIAIVRADHAAGVLEACQAMAYGGLGAVEVTMTTPGALRAIEQARTHLGEQCLIGVGSVRDAATAVQAIDAGAQCVVSPIFKQEVLEAAHARGVPVIPGALTPTEIAAAQQAGADLVKVFPANHFGPRYFKEVLAPMPELRLMPTGGVTLDNLGQWFDAGAACLGVGSALVRQDLIRARDWDALSEMAARFVAAAQGARQK